MKLKKICLLVSGLLLFSCGENVSSNFISNSDSTPISSSDYVGLHYSSDDETRLTTVLKTSIPCVRCATKYTISELTASDSSASLFTIVFVGMSNFETAMSDYKNDLESLGFETAYDEDNGVDFGQKKVDSDLVQVAYYSDLSSKNFTVEAYIYYNYYPTIVESSSWPTSEVYSFTGGIVVPSYSPSTSSGFEYNIGSDDTGPYMIIYVNNAPSGAVEEYNEILENNRWTLNDEYYSTSFKTMIAVDYTNSIKLYYQIDDGDFKITITFNVSDGNNVIDGGGETTNMTPTVEKPETYSNSYLHGFVLSPSESSNYQKAISINPSDYSVVDSQKFSFDIQCGAFYGGKYYFFTTEYKFGYSEYTEENGYGTTFIQSSINEVVNELYYDGYYLVPMDMSFNYSDNTMYVLWAKWGLVDSDNDGYYDSLSEEGFEDQYISKFNLITYEAGVFKDIVTTQTEGTYTSTVLSGIAFDLEGNLYGVAHSKECLCKIVYDEENDNFNITKYLTNKAEGQTSYKNHFQVDFPGSWLGCMGRLFMEYMHATLAFDYSTGKLYYAWSDWKSYTIDAGGSSWSGDLGCIMEINPETGISTGLYEFEDDAEITGLFSVYYK